MKIIILLLFTCALHAQSFFISDTLIKTDMIGGEQKTLSIKTIPTLFEFYIMDSEIRIISRHIVKKFKIDQINDGERTASNPIKFQYQDGDTETYLFLFISPKQIIILRKGTTEALIYLYNKSF